MNEAETDIGSAGMIKTSAWGGTCPFRGHAPPSMVEFRIPLDERCPEFVPVHVIPMENGTARKPGGIDAVPIPILRDDTYCRACVDENVREVEAGRAPRVKRPSSPSTGSALRRGRRRPNRKEQIERLAKKLQESR